ncbi:helical backbone metal receptor [Marinactinospora thermotolerans]|uniref:helical backbone metal receptor n=1 Tax=Marinactinospora thermotolerans TaxID=531310 RepID=UPI00099998D0|nr:helical backbone metal receptor [Marinactinospora thermotolerans]
MSDDTGAAVTPRTPVRRVVSLVPSLTEAVAGTAPGLLVGATDWCSHPPGLSVTRVGGTKSPDLARVIALRPDLVLANFEENRPQDLEALRAAGIAVWTTVIRTLPEALDSLERALAACGRPAPSWLRRARATWEDVLGEPPAPVRRAAVPIWRRPWMALGRDTFAGDVLARLGVANVHADASQRYPRLTPRELASGAELLVFPDEPYAFGPQDGPEAFPGVTAAFVSGRDLTWYGPSLVAARGRLERALGLP